MHRHLYSGEGGIDGELLFHSLLQAGIVNARAMGSSALLGIVCGSGELADRLLLPSACAMAIAVARHGTTANKTSFLVMFRSHFGWVAGGYTWGA